MKKIVFLLMVVLMFNQTNMYVKADFIPESATSKLNSYRIDFSDEMSITSCGLYNVLTNCKDSIDEVIFSVDAGVDIFTIGYYRGQDDFKISEMLSSILREISGIKQDIINDERLSNDNYFSVDDVKLKTIVITCKETAIDNITDTLPYVARVRINGVDIKEFESFDDDFLGNCNNRTYTVNGSSHYIDTNLFGYDAYWYNQLSGSISQCSHSFAVPHMGDGNNRYDSGFQWFPNQMEVDFTEDYSYNKNRTRLWYQYNQNTINNLKVDNNEALELEVVYYNYSNASSWSQKGDAFQLPNSVTWSTNQPNSYLDTNFMDDPNEVSFCVGVEDCSSLTYNSYYYWGIDSQKGNKSNNYPNDGRFKVVAQRSYQYLGTGAFSIFAEEHESIRKLGVPYGYSWVPATQSAWVYASGGQGGYFNFNSSISPIQ